MRIALICVAVIVVAGFGWLLYQRSLPKDAVYDTQQRVTASCSDSWQQLGYASSKDCEAKLSTRYIKEK